MASEEDRLLAGAPKIEDEEAPEPRFDDDDDTPKKGKAAKRGVNALQLTMMIYFFTSGGPFGIEPAVGNGGPLLTLIALVIIPVFWSLPQALMAAELSLLIDENGGNVVWVRKAFGDTIGWFNAFNNIAQSFSSLAILVVLFVAYIPGYKTMPAYQNWLVKLSFILINALLNILGLRWISRLSVFFLIFVLSPFVWETIVVAYEGKVDFELLRFVPEYNDMNISVFLSTVIWSFGGFDSMGSLAGEVKGGRKTFMTGILGSFPLIFVNYFIPIVIGYSVDSNWKCWDTGYFGTVSYEVPRAAHYLGPWMVAASALSNFGQFNAAMAPLSRVIWSMSKSGYLPPFIGWSWQRHTGTIRPIGAVVFTAITITAVTALPYNFLVQLFLAIRVFNLGCEYAALIKLRYSMPDAHRPFVVPGGMIGAWLIGMPSAIIAAYTLIYSDYKAYLYAAIVNILVVMGYVIRIAYRKFLARKTKSAANLN